MKGVSESLRYSGAGLYLGAALVLALLAGFAVYSFLHAAVPNGSVFTVTCPAPARFGQIARFFDQRGLRSQDSDSVRQKRGLPCWAQVTEAFTSV
ncbi:MAG TPA: hypothetical protein VD969_06280, partial [Symbiobacteriaceae bacterium]|nr:hypothetical protein [Symbiobacteriaceae bacterium]